MRVGIFFGGQSREREVSFAGGRTVFDNLDKDLFEAVPIFIDSLGNFILLDWQYIYKGTIRDFYPPSKYDERSKHPFQVYIESLESDDKTIDKIISEVGKQIRPHQFKEYFDFAFLALHGPQGEDGSIQGILEWYQIPYSGSGIFPSSTGIDKIIQKGLLSGNQNLNANYTIIEKDRWDSKEHHKAIFDEVIQNLGDNIVVKAPHQGSSIGITILKESNFKAFEMAIEKAFFREKFNLKEWRELSIKNKIRSINEIADIRSGIGFPLRIDENIIIHPEDLFEVFKTSNKEELLLESMLSEDAVLIEPFLEGEEFSCIVIESEDGKPIALPPTQIKKPSDIFDYRAKYLPGISRKITPINLPEEEIETIRTSCEDLYSKLNCDVYARLDGFISRGKVHLNDPNTTSGMLPSSFFFHQAAEIGLSPSQFLTYIIRTSIRSRIKSAKYSISLIDYLKKLDDAILSKNKGVKKKERVAVIMGGFSSERHISVESGRNIFEKLSSSQNHEPFPVFLKGDSNAHELFEIPVNIMLKDNADDIRDKIENFKIHPVIHKIRKQADHITQKYTGHAIPSPQKISYSELKKKADSAFIALHGRPGEDGTIQKELEKLKIPYNGSTPETSQLTINKFETNEVLSKNGILVADHLLARKDDFKTKAEQFFSRIERSFTYPFIVKPADDGCSSAVAMVQNREELAAYTKLIFRDIDKLDEGSCDILKISYKEEFPIKKEFVIENLISQEDAKHFLEITGGLLTHKNSKGQIEIEMFEPSEALATGDILSLEEKFLAGEGQNITPARYSDNVKDDKKISNKVKKELKKVAEVLNIQGYARIDAFVRIYSPEDIKVYIIEVNSLPGMTPATCIFHQSAINSYTPLEFISEILNFGKQRVKEKSL